MNAMRFARRLAATAPFALSLLSLPPSLAAASAPTLAPGQIASIDPPVPRPAGQPCVVQLLQNRAWPQDHVYVVNDPTYSYAPPVACPPPWSKVVLTLDIQSNRRSVVDWLGMDLANVRLFHTATPRYGGNAYWHVERDLTDYSALFKAPQSGLLWSYTDPDNELDGDVFDFAFTANAQLLFYPATAAAPAPHVPDAVIAVNEGSPVDLPHNIVRAYLDVESDYQSNAFWYTCASNDSTAFPLGDAFAPGGIPFDSIFPPNQGCAGGSFQEIKVGVDGTPAGIAPAFPLIVADLSWALQNSADQPITTLEMLNFKPYRVDLTPFAGVLSAAGGHNVTADNETGGATLLLYLDPRKTQIVGAVTLNTLANENGAATDVVTLKQSGQTISGDIATRQQRNFEIRGYVYDSRGRVESTVHQTSHFTNTQAFLLEGPSQPPINVLTDKLYRQALKLDSSVQETSSSTIGGRLISRDQINVQYPLALLYSIATQVFDQGDGWLIDYKRTEVSVDQQRTVDGDHYRPGAGYYTTHADGGFHSVLEGGDAQPDPRWQSSTTRDYRDTFGSCYRAAMKSDGGTITRLTHGEGCPRGRDEVIWFAHPDGSPGSDAWH
jgi:hypothetical protein